MSLPNHIDPSELAPADVPARPTPVARLAAILTIYFTDTAERTEQADHRFETLLDTYDGLYRRPLLVPSEWTPLDLAWAKSPEMLVIVNDEPESYAGRGVEVLIGSGIEPGVSGTWLVPPRRFLAGKPSSPDILLRSLGRPSQITVYAVPSEG